MSNGRMNVVRQKISGAKQGGMPVGPPIMPPQLTHPGIIGKPTSCRIDKYLIHVDLSYQRRLKPARLRKLRREWSTALMGVISVARRPSGKLYVVDGQHRLVIAKERGDVGKVACFVYNTNGKRETEAWLYKKLNDVAAQTAFDKYGAALTSKEKDAMLVDRTCKKHGYVPMPRGKSKDHTVVCIKMLRGWASADPPLFEKIFALAAELYGGKRIHNCVIAGLATLEQNLRGIGDPNTVLSGRHHKKLCALGGPKLEKELIDGARGFSSGNNSNAALANALIVILNRSIRIHKMKWVN